MTALVEVSDERWCGECEIRGILAPWDSTIGINMCDECDAYEGDVHAALALASLVPGGVVRIYVDHGGRDEEYDYDELDQLEIRTVISEDDLAEGEYIAYHTNPWVELNGVPIDWMTYQLPTQTQGAAT